MVKDGVITLPVSSLEEAVHTKAVQLLSEIPGVNGVKTNTTMAIRSAASLIKIEWSITAYERVTTFEV